MTIIYSWYFFEIIAGPLSPSNRPVYGRHVIPSTSMRSFIVIYPKNSNSDLKNSDTWQIAKREVLTLFLVAQKSFLYQQKPQAIVFNSCKLLKVRKTLFLGRNRPLKKSSFYPLKSGIVRIL